MVGVQQHLDGISVKEKCSVLYFVMQRCTDRRFNKKKLQALLLCIAKLYAASKVTEQLTWAPLSESAEEFDVTMGSGSASL